MAAFLMALGELGKGASLADKVLKRKQHVELLGYTEQRMADHAIRAAHTGNLVALERALEGGADPNAGDSMGWTALMYACRGPVPAPGAKGSDGGGGGGGGGSGDDEDDGPPVPAAIDARVLYPLTMPGLEASEAAAALHEPQHLECVRALLARGADVNVAAKAGTTALMVCGSAAAAEELCAQRPGNDGRPIYTHGLDPAAVDRQGCTAVLCAARAGRPAVVTSLARLGQPMDARDALAGWTAMHHAAWHGDVPTLSALAKGGADPAAVDRQRNETPIDLAARRHGDGKIVGGAPPSAAWLFFDRLPLYKGLEAVACGAVPFLSTEEARWCAAPHVIPVGYEDIDLLLHQQAKEKEENGTAALYTVATETQEDKERRRVARNCERKRERKEAKKKKDAHMRVLARIDAQQREYEKASGLKRTTTMRKITVPRANAGTADARLALGVSESANVQSIGGAGGLSSVDIHMKRHTSLQDRKRDHRRRERERQQQQQQEQLSPLSAFAQREKKNKKKGGGGVSSAFLALIGGDENKENGGRGGDENGGCAQPPKRKPLSEKALLLQKAKMKKAREKKQVERAKHQKEQEERARILLRTRQLQVDLTDDARRAETVGKCAAHAAPKNFELPSQEHDGETGATQRASPSRRQQQQQHAFKTPASSKSRGSCSTPGDAASPAFNADTEPRDGRKPSQSSSAPSSSWRLAALRNNSASILPEGGMGSRSYATPPPPIGRGARPEPPLSEQREGPLSTGPLANARRLLGTPSPGFLQRRGKSGGKVSPSADGYESAALTPMSASSSSPSSSSALALKGDGDQRQASPTHGGGSRTAPNGQSLRAVREAQHLAHAVAVKGNADAAVLRRVRETLGGSVLTVPGGRPRKKKMQDSDADEAATGTGLHARWKQAKKDKADKKMTETEAMAILRGKGDGIMDRALRFVKREFYNYMDWEAWGVKRTNEAEDMDIKNYVTVSMRRASALGLRQEKIRNMGEEEGGGRHARKRRLHMPSLPNFMAWRAGRDIKKDQDWEDGSREQAAHSGVAQTAHRAGGDSGGAKEQKAKAKAAKTAMLGFANKLGIGLPEELPKESARADEHGGKRGEEPQKPPESERSVDDLFEPGQGH